MSIYKNKDEAEKARLLQEAYEDAYTPEQRQEQADFMKDWFASIFPPEWQKDPPPPADIINIKTRKKL